MPNAQGPPTAGGPPGPGDPGAPRGPEDPGRAGGPPGSEGPGGPTETERNWALASHIGSLLAAYVFLGLLCPLIVLLAKGNESEFIRTHAVESLNFQITAVIAAVISTILIFVIVGIIMLIVIGIAYLVFVILATMAASRGEPYRYPVTIRFVR